MKKCLKLTALCCCFVLLLSIMLISNIPKTYASSTVDSYRNVLKPDYVVYSDWNNEEGEPFIDTDLYFDVPLTISDFNNTTNNTISMDSYNNETEDLNYATIQYSFDSLNNNVVTYSWNVYETSEILFYWGTYAIQKSSVDTFRLVIESSSSGVEFYDVHISGYFRDVAPVEYFSFTTSIDNIDGLDLTSITDSMSSHFNGSILVLTDLKITITNINSYSGLRFSVSSSVSSLDGDVKSLLLLNYESPDADINFNFGAWLLENANSFLAFELVPGFSLSSLLALLVGIPLLLWLFKMLLGG